MQNKMRIIWSEIAQKRYEDVIFYLDENCSSKTLIKFRNSVKKTLNMLLQNPYIGRTDERYKHTRKIFIGGYIYIYYQVIEEHIWIVAFWDTRQDPKNLII